MLPSPSLMLMLMADCYVSKFHPVIFNAVFIFAIAVVIPLHHCCHHHHPGPSSAPPLIVVV